MRKYSLLIAWILALEGIGYSFGLLTKHSVDSWYVDLALSPLTPPNYLFGIAWSILYIMMAVSGWLLWQADELKQSQAIKCTYITQLALNWSWTPIFFYYQMTGAALICITLLIFFVGYLIVITYKASKASSLLLIPYFIWLMFASHLNFYIWMYN